MLLADRSLHAGGLSRQGQAGVLVFQWQGKRKEMGVGSALTVTLGEARERARAVRAALETGKNPIDERRAERASKEMHTFGAIAVLLGCGPVLLRLSMGIRRRVPDALVQVNGSTSLRRVR